jgi:hypothetical protein
MGRDHRQRVDHRTGASAAPTKELGVAPGRRFGGPSQDTALYNCHCGFVFTAMVSTSVGCPHCGGTQAW